MQNSERKWSEVMNLHLCLVLLSVSCFYYCPSGYIKITAPTSMLLVTTVIQYNHLHLHFIFESMSPKYVSEWISEDELIFNFIIKLTPGSHSLNIYLFITTLKKKFMTNNGWFWDSWTSTGQNIKKYVFPFTCRILCVFTVNLIVSRPSHKAFPSRVMKDSEETWI
jgi:hypothetical protein